MHNLTVREVLRQARFITLPLGQGPFTSRLRFFLKQFTTDSLWSPKNDKIPSLSSIKINNAFYDLQPFCVFDETNANNVTI